LKGVYNLLNGVTSQSHRRTDTGRTSWTAWGQGSKHVSPELWSKDHVGILTLPTSPTEQLETGWSAIGQIDATCWQPDLDVSAP